MACRTCCGRADQPWCSFSLTAPTFSSIFVLASARLRSRSTRLASFCAASAAASVASTSAATCAAGCRSTVAPNPGGELVERLGGGLHRVDDQGGAAGQDLRGQQRHGAVLSGRPIDIEHRAGQRTGTEAEQHAQGSAQHTDERAEQPAGGGTDADDLVIALRTRSVPSDARSTRAALRTCRLVRLSPSPRSSLTAWYAWLDCGNG